MFSRLSLYLKEMFPLQLYIPFAALSFFGLYFSVQMVMGTGPLVLGLPAIVGFFTVFSFSLLMRIFDEFKDLEVDKVLFPYRAVARGAVYPSDLKKLGWSLVIIMAATNFYLGWVVIPFIAALVFGFLTFKWFFLKKQLSNHLLLSLLTHQPMGLFVYGYAASIALMAIDASSVSVWTLVVVLAYFFPITAWETARKIRAPSQETDYVTYSKILGPRWACCLPLFFLTLSGVLFLLLSTKLNMPAWSFWAIASVLVLYASVCLRFIIMLDTKSNIVRSATELSSSLIQILVLVLLVMEFGLSL